MCGADGASISSSSRVASPNAGSSAATVPRYRISRFASSIRWATIVLKRNVAYSSVTIRSVRWAAIRIDRVGGRRVLAGRQVARAALGAGLARLDAVRVERDRPDAVQEPVDAADAGRAPRAALVPRPHEHQEQPDRVGAVALHQLVGVLDVAAALAHPLAVGAQDLALVEQLLERLAVIDQAHVRERLREEARVQQVHDGVLGAAGVLVDRAPALGQVARRAGRPSSCGRR